LSQTDRRTKAPGAKTDAILVASHVPPDEPSPDKPPEKGDWIQVQDFDHYDKIVSVDDNGIRIWWLIRKFELASLKSNYRIVRRKDAPLQVGDKGLLDGKIECFVLRAQPMGNLIRIVFRAKDITENLHEFAEIDRSRFTLTRPVFDRRRIDR